jgi:hypothetical protein
VTDKKEITFENMTHEEYYQSAIRALKDGIHYPEANMREQSTFLIALIDISMALYLFLREEKENHENQARIQAELERNLWLKKK